MGANYLSKLSFGGRITLTKQHIQSTYLLSSTVKIPKGVVLEIEDYKINLLGMAETSKLNLIIWKIVFQGKMQSGLAFGGLVNKNITLLEKRVWRFPWEQLLLGPSL